MGHEDSFLRGQINDIRLYKRDMSKKLMHQQSVLDEEDMGRLDANVYRREATLYKIKYLCEQPICNPHDIENAKIGEFTEEVLSYLDKNTEDKKNYAEIKKDVEQFVNDLRANVKRSKMRSGEAQVEILGSDPRCGSVNNNEEKQIKTKNEAYPEEATVSSQVDHLSAILQENSAYEPLLKKENDE